MDEVVYRVFMAANPIDGSPIYQDVYKSEIEEFFGIKWDELNAGERMQISNELEFVI